MDKKEILEILRESLNKGFTKEYVIFLIEIVRTEEQEQDIQKKDVQGIEAPTVSLYEYLGYAANKELGGKVYRTAKALHQSVGSRDVSNKSYTGKVMLYTRTFLDKYFKY